MIDFKKTFLLCVIIGLSGCSGFSHVTYEPQSRFTYPNSNITTFEFGNVSAEIEKSSLSPFTGITQEIKEELINKALQQKPEANILVDYYITTKVKVIPVVFFSITSVLYKVQGIAAKGEVINRGISDQRGY